MRKKTKKLSGTLLRKHSKSQYKNYSINLELELRIIKNSDTYLKTYNLYCSTNIFTVEQILFFMNMDLFIKVLIVFSSS